MEPNQPIMLVCPRCFTVCVQGRSFTQHTNRSKECVSFIADQLIPYQHFTIGHTEQRFFVPTVTQSPHRTGPTPRHPLPAVLNPNTGETSTPLNEDQIRGGKETGSLLVGLSSESDDDILIADEDNATQGHTDDPPVPTTNHDELCNERTVLPLPLQPAVEHDPNNTKRLSFILSWVHDLQSI